MDEKASGVYGPDKISRVGFAEGCSMGWDALAALVKNFQHYLPLAVFWWIGFGVAAAVCLAGGLYGVLIVAIGGALRIQSMMVASMKFEQRLGTNKPMGFLEICRWNASGRGLAKLSALTMLSMALAVAACFVLKALADAWMPQPPRLGGWIYPLLIMAASMACGSWILASWSVGLQGCAESKAIRSVGSLWRKTWLGQLGVWTPLALITFGAGWWLFETGLDAGTSNSNPYADVLWNGALLLAYAGFSIGGLSVVAGRGFNRLAAKAMMREDHGE